MPNDDPAVSEEERELFDAHLQIVIDELPEHVRLLLEEMPVIVDDAPSRDILLKMGITHARQLCGLHTGIALTHRSVNHSGVLADVIHLFRQGILDQATDRRGFIDEEELRHQIRITLLHEIGHHFGLDEDALRALGYG